MPGGEEPIDVDKKLTLGLKADLDTVGAEHLENLAKSGEVRGALASTGCPREVVDVVISERLLPDGLVDRLGPLVADYEPFYERAETANGVFTRIQLGPIASKEVAERLCVEIQQQNASCFVVSP